MSHLQEQPEKREHVRFPFPAETKVLVSDQPEGLIKTADCVRLTERGLVMAVAEPVPPGEMIELKFTLPDGQDTVYATGVVEEVLPADTLDGEKAALSLRFHGSSPEELELIGSLLERGVARNAKGETKWWSLSPTGEPPVQTPLPEPAVPVTFEPPPEPLVEAVGQPEAKEAQPTRSAELSAHVGLEGEDSTSALEQTTEGWQATVRYHTFRGLLDALIMNISKGGVMIGSPLLLDEGTEIQVHLVPPGLPRGMWFVGHVVGTSRGVGFGVQFTDLTPARLSALSAIVAEAARKGPGLAETD